jgi:hypothetical protein
MMEVRLRTRSQLVMVIVWTIIPPSEAPAQVPDLGRVGRAAHRGPGHVLEWVGRQGAVIPTSTPVTAPPTRSWWRGMVSRPSVLRNITR